MDIQLNLNLELENFQKPLGVVEACWSKASHHPGLSHDFRKSLHNTGRYWLGSGVVLACWNHAWTMQQFLEISLLFESAGMVEPWLRHAFYQPRPCTTFGNWVTMSAAVWECWCGWGLVKACLPPARTLWQFLEINSEYRPLFESAGVVEAWLNHAFHQPRSHQDFMKSTHNTGHCCKIVMLLLF